MIKSLNYHISPTIYPLINLIMTITIRYHYYDHYSHEISPVTNHYSPINFKATHDMFYHGLINNF